MPHAGSHSLLAIVILAGVSSAAAQTDDRRSGFEFMSRESQAMQRDDTSNPGMLWVLEGESLWMRRDGAANRSCADCHGATAGSMRGVAVRYPAFDAKRGQPIDLQGRVNVCRETQQNATPLPLESRELLALTAYVANQSRGMPIAPDDDPRLKSFTEAGRELYQRRQGQLNFSCSNCHDAHWGQKLASAVIPQSHPTGYPLYRLEWQSLGSLQRRLRNCMVGVRAEPYPFGAPEYVALELYLMSRARGMPLETPAIRP